jgi:hypothetical protein
MRELLSKGLLAGSVLKGCREGKMGKVSVVEMLAAASKGCKYRLIKIRIRYFFSFPFMATAGLYMDKRGGVD